MNNLVYVWLFNNINRYNFEGIEAKQIKTAVSKMPLIEDSMLSAETVAKMQELYNSFCKLFYNNILGYQNGLADNKITSSELDCYFLQTAEGQVPIGYYKNNRPVETVVLVQAYLNQCQEDFNDKKDQTVKSWQRNIDDISQKYETIKKSKSSSILRIIVVIIFSFILVWFSTSYWSNKEDEVGYLVFIIVGLEVIVIGMMFIIKKEVQFLIAQKNIKHILNDVLVYVNRCKQEIVDSLEVISARCYKAARRGENVKIAKEQKPRIYGDIEDQIQKLTEVINKTESRKTRISYILISVLLVTIVFLVFAYDWIPNDSVKIVEQYRQAAEQGDADAQFDLGLAYNTGYGVSKDFAKAVEWYRQAIKQGHAGAQCNLGWAYDNGYGVSEDPVEAVEWYRKSAEQGYADAQYKLGLAYDNGRGVLEDSVKAVEWYRKSAEQGHADAQYKLGLAYYNGKGVLEDSTEAVKWFRKAAEQGDADAQDILDDIL